LAFVDSAELEEGSVHTLVPESVATDRSGTPLTAFDSELNPDETVWVRTSEDGERVYPGLTPTEWETIETGCTTVGDAADREVAVELLKQFRDWKYDPVSQRASRHECLFARVLGDDATATRGLEGDDEARQDLLETVDTADRAMAEELRQLSIEVAEEYDLFSTRLYRGIGHHLRDIVAAVFTDPLQETYLTDTDFSVLTNFTLDEDVAQRFSEIILQIELTEDRLVSVPDFLTHTVVYYHGPEEWRPVPEAELRIRGETLTDISRDQLTIAMQSDSTPCFPDLVADIPLSIAEYDVNGPPQFTQEEHLALRHAALSFAEYEYTDRGVVKNLEPAPPTASEALDRLSVWLDIFMAEFESTSSDEPTKTQVETIIQEVIADGRA
jgi:hypothetical protein